MTRLRLTVLHRTSAADNGKPRPAWYSRPLAFRSLLDAVAAART